MGMQQPACLPTRRAHPLVRCYQVVYTGEGAAPLLRVVNHNPEADPVSGAALVPSAREEHLVPFVREIVPAVDADARVALLQAPPGLLELGRRQGLLESLRPQLLVRPFGPCQRCAAADTARAAGAGGCHRTAECACH